MGLFCGFCSLKMMGDNHFHEVEVFKVLRFVDTGADGPAVCAVLPYHVPVCVGRTVAWVKLFRLMA